MAEYRASLYARPGSRTAFDIEVRDFSLAGDGLVESGADGAGPTPFEYLATALGTCTGLTIRGYARKRNIPLEDIAVRVTHHSERSVGGAPAEHSIRTEIALHGPLTEEQRQELLQAAEGCPVHQFYQTIPTIEAVLVDEIPRTTQLVGDTRAAD
jgi:putative redox protein